MELRKIDTLLFKMLYLAEAGIVVTQVLARSSLTSTLFLLTFPLTVLLWFSAIRRTVAETDIIMIIAAVLAVVGVLLNAAAANANIGFPYLKKMIMFIMSLLFLQTSYRMRISEELAVFINRIVDAVTLFLIGMYFLQYPQMHLFHGRVTVYLTFRFTNPNLTAMFLICLYMLKMHRLFSRSKWYVKLYHIVTSLFLAWFVVETYARNCLLVLVLYTVVTSWMTLRGWKDMRVSRGWAGLFACFPALFVAGYMALIPSRWIQNLLSFLVGEGKDLDSRVSIWGPALERLWNSPLTGAYYEISHGTGSSQMHNSHLDIATSYGILPLVLVCVLLARYLHQNGRVYTEKNKYSNVLGFACAIMLGLGEAAIFSGGLGIYILVGTFLLLANQEKPEGKDELSV